MAAVPQSATLATETAVSASSTGTTAQNLPSTVQAFVFELNVTSAAAAAGDTLDVFVQTRLDGTNWVDIVAFTRVLGDGGALRHTAKISATEPQAMFSSAATLAAGNVRHIIGQDYRIRYVIGGGTPVFSFSVYAIGL